MALAEARFAQGFASISSFGGEEIPLVVPPIPVVWHVISAGDALTDGNVPQSQVDASITDMNTHFAYVAFASHPIG